MVQRGAALALGTGSAGVSANAPAIPSINRLADGCAHGPSAGGRMGALPAGIQRAAGVCWSAAGSCFGPESGRDVSEQAECHVRPAFPDRIQRPASCSTCARLETIATPGANDNCSGVGTTLEIARVLARAVKRGDSAPAAHHPFLWVPEISGSRAYMYKNADPAGSVAGRAELRHDWPRLERPIPTSG